MSEKKDGGPAYPGDEKVTVTSIGELSGKEYKQDSWKYQSGMSLRDWFAGMALSNFEIRRYQYESNYHLIAEACYKLADAMLKEREN